MSSFFWSMLNSVIPISQGSYVLSTIVQIRTSFPPIELSPESNLFATLPAYQMFGALFDGSFIAAACLTAVSLWARARLNGATIF